MNTQKFLGKTLLVLTVTSCTYSNNALEQALQSAGNNRPELEKVLEHYSLEPEKLKAAHFLIENMPAHYSYKDSMSIQHYYDRALEILSQEQLSPEQQRDSLLHISKTQYADINKSSIPDNQIIGSDYLIHSIDHAFESWKKYPWAKHLNFEEFLEWLLPYKMVEFQELDYWRDTLFTHFTDNLRAMIPDDVEYNTTLKTAETIKNEVATEMNRYGLYTESGLPLLSARLLHRQTFGNIPDYALVGALALRSAGIPVVLDETPVGARFEAASRWFVVLSDRGTEEWSEWDLSTNIGWGFFPYERGPKVFRNSYAINRERYLYKKRAKYVYPFELSKQDITDRYFRTSDIEIPIEKGLRLADRYVYIASAVRDEKIWQIVDFGTLKHRRAHFKKMGREVLYKAFGYNGDELIPICKPFILHKNGEIEYINEDTIHSEHLDIWKNNSL